MHAHDQERARSTGVPGRSVRATPPAEARTAPVGFQSPASLIALQRFAGNAAVNRTLAQLQRAQLQRAQVQRAAVDEDQVEDRPPVQRSMIPEVLNKPGRPLDPEIRALAEAGSYEDFSTVRVIEGPEAARSAAEIDALAYTSGEKVVVAGDLSVETWLHELGHVDHQRKGPVPGTDLGNGVSVSSENDPGERYADAWSAETLIAARSGHTGHAH